MTNDSLDTRYAYAQGRWARMNSAPRLSRSARFWRMPVPIVSPRGTRIDTTERFVEFFTARTVFGTPESSYAEIRSAYFEQVKGLHPDTHREDKAAEEQLKVINAAYEVIDKIHKEARDYYDQDTETRHEEEQKARQITEKEAAAESGQTHAKARTQYKPDPSWASYTAQARRSEEPPQTHPTIGPVRYMAFSVPRYIRLSRLYYLALHAIIGSRAVRCSGGRLLVYDVIMLPEMDFRRAKLNLGIEGHGSPELSMTRLVPAYIPIDTKTVIVPKEEKNASRYAKDYFMEEFRLKPIEDTGQAQPASA